MRLSAVFDAIPDALIIVDNQGCIVQTNHQVAILFGYRRSELLGKRVEQLIPERFHSKHTDYQQSYYSNPQARPVRYKFDLFGLKADGTEFPIEISFNSLDTDEGQFILEVIHDITIQKQLEEELQTKNTELEKIDLAKDRFLSGMSHELRTPLNVIIGFTDTLLMKLPGPINAEQEKQLKIVGTSANHLLSIINDILDIAKIEAEQGVALNVEQVNCVEVVKEVIATLLPLAKAKKIKLLEKITSNDISLMADRRAITQILINLVNNAIKFTKKGSVSIELLTAKCDDREFVVINIIDTGIGIKPDDKEKIFTAFKQVGTFGQQGTGTGLGLYLSKKLAELMHGKIEFESELGKGSRFSVVLPKIVKWS